LLELLELKGWIVTIYAMGCQHVIAAQIVSPCLLDPDDARDRLAWGHGGFSLDASVCIAGRARRGPR